MRFKLLRPWATRTWACRRGAVVTVVMLLLIGLGGGHWVLASRRAEVLQRSHDFATLQATALTKQIDDRSVNMLAARSIEASDSLAADRAAEQDWHLQRHLSVGSNRVTLTDFRVNALGADTRKRGYLLSLRGSYLSVIALTERTIKLDAGMALLGLSCGVVPAGGEQIDCSLTLQRWAPAEANP